MRTQLEPLRVAVIGGGVSGLSMAYYMQQQHAPGDRPVEIDIYERRATLGGNAETVLLDLGDYVDAHGRQTAYRRWADLGVNDVNLATYFELKQVLETIGYLEHLKPLQDSACYFSRDGLLALTDDSALRGAVTDPAFAIGHADEGRLSRLAEAVHRAAFDLLDAGVSIRYTVADFFGDCIADPQGMLSRAACALEIAIDWTDAHLPARLARVRDAIYYPRIAAMYFTDDRGPGSLPLQSPFAYYQLQEGKNQPADRRYFAHGAQKWIEALAAYVLAQSNDQVRVRIHCGSPATVEVQPHRLGVRRPGRDSARFDLCMLTTHADDTLALLDFGTPLRDASARIAAILSQVRYTCTYAVCHSYAAVMPQNKNIWRTYNVLQRDAGDTSHPYRMTYVGNLHQNDPANPAYAQAGLPLFLISMVSSLDEIPVQAMLARAPAGARGERAASALEGKAWRAFKHNVLDASCLQAQADIAAFNREVTQALGGGDAPACALLFGGSWTYGAGLHEECLLQSKALAAALAPALRKRVAASAAMAHALRGRAA